MSPQRIQLRRTKGWRLPSGARSVARPTKWGNPFKIGAAHPVHGWPMSRQETVDLFELHVGVFGLHELEPESLNELRGHDLACWCPLEDSLGNKVPCHADILLEIANG